MAADDGWDDMAALQERCRRHLARQGIVLWSQTFEIHEADGLDQAASWLAQEIVAVLEDR
jgi:hypothetical protein